MISVAQLVSYVGTVVTLKWLYEFVSFLVFHFSPPTVDQFIYGPAPYALITGATDGIGKETAKELYTRGFNVILHGRNPEKLRKVVDELKKLGSRDIRTWIEDASRENIDFSKAVEQWNDLEITLVVHNVGGAPVRAERIDAVPEVDLMNDIRCNQLFPFLLTRAILPKLRRAAGPAQMVYVGSYSSEQPLPRLTPYSSTKAFIKQLSRSLGTDERYWARTNVSTLCVLVGSVVSGSHPKTPSLFTPAAAPYARAMVDKFGCGRELIAPYLLHALQFWSVEIIPKPLLEKTMVQEMEEEIKLAKRR